MQSARGKSERQQAILKIIRKTAVVTQMELRDALKAVGFECDQATVSRDIKDLGLVRVVDEHGTYRYAMLEDASPTVHATKLSILKRFIRRIDHSGNLLVIVTDSANAGPVAEAIDHLGFEDIIGTIAGDNTVLAVVKEGLKAQTVAEKLLKEIDR